MLTLSQKTCGIFSPTLLRTEIACMGIFFLNSSERDIEHAVNFLTGKQINGLHHLKYFKAG